MKWDFSFLDTQKKVKVKHEGVNATMLSLARNADKPCKCGNPRYRNSKGEVASNLCYECHKEARRKTQRLRRAG